MNLFPKLNFLSQGEDYNNSDDDVGSGPIINKITGKKFGSGPIINGDDYAGSGVELKGLALLFYLCIFSPIKN